MRRLKERQLWFDNSSIPRATKEKNSVYDTIVKGIINFTPSYQLQQLWVAQQRPIHLLLLEQLQK